MAHRVSQSKVHIRRNIKETPQGPHQPHRSPRHSAQAKVGIPGTLMDSSSRLVNNQWASSHDAVLPMGHSRLQSHNRVTRDVFIGSKVELPQLCPVLTR